MRFFDRWWHETRRVGRAMLLASCLAAGVLAAGAALSAPTGPASAVAPAMLYAVEMAMPLVAGVTAACVVGRDPAVELHLTLPAGYRGTLMRRWTVAMTASALPAAAICAALMASGWWARWPRTHGVLLGQLTWGSPLACLSGLGLLAAAVLRSPGAAATVVLTPWLLEQLLPDQVGAHRWSRMLYLFATTGGNGAEWMTNRLILLATAVVLAAAAWLLLGRGARLLGGDSE
jgi:hypothetical protein